VVFSTKKSVNFRVLFSNFIAQCVICVCAWGICLALLTDFTNSQQILTKNEASTILKSRTKRDNNNIFEELGKDNLERECIEQSCSSEEMMEIWKNAPGRQEIVGGRKKYHALRTELKRIRKVQNSKKNPETKTVQIQNNLEGDCRNDDECATYFQVLNDPCSVEVDTFLLDPEFSISGWNTSEAVNVNEVCWGPGTGWFLKLIHCFHQF